MVSKSIMPILDFTLNFLSVLLKNQIFTTIFKNMHSFSSILYIFFLTVYTYNLVKLFYFAGIKITYVLSLIVICQPPHF